MGPHRPERRRTACNRGIPAHASSALPGPDENGIESSANGIDAAGYADPGRSGATATTEGEGQGSGTKTGSRAGEAEPKADTRFSDAKSGAIHDKDSRRESSSKQPQARRAANHRVRGSDGRNRSAEEEGGKQ